MVSSSFSLGRLTTGTVLTSVSDRKMLIMLAYVVVVVVVVMNGACF